LSHPRSSAGKAAKERASVASVVPSSFLASGGAGTSVPNSIPRKLLNPILEDSCRPHQRIFDETPFQGVYLVWRLVIDVGIPSTGCNMPRSGFT